MKILYLFFLCFNGKVVFGRGSGAPETSCDHMIPGHVDFVPIVGQQLSKTPYKVKAEIDGAFVRLAVSGSRSLAGFLIQARETESGPAMGEFKLTANTRKQTQYQNCQSVKYPEFSSITHKNPDAKFNITFLWTPAAIRTQNITVRFYATLAASHDVFWVKQPSNKINILDIGSNSAAHAFITFWSTLPILIVVTFMMIL